MPGSSVSRGGFAMEGRHRSLEIVRAGRQQVEGAHCTGQNVVAVGIENEGTYTSVDPPPAQWNRLRDLCAWICSRYGIHPTELYGHRDFKNTACPGDRLYGLLPKLRTEVAAVLGQRVTTVVKASWPLVPRTVSVLLIVLEMIWIAGVALLQAAMPAFHFLLGLPSIGATPVLLRTTLPVP